MQVTVGPAPPGYVDLIARGAGDEEVEIRRWWERLLASGRVINVKGQRSGNGVEVRVRVLDQRRPAINTVQSREETTRPALEVGLLIGTVAGVVVLSGWAIVSVATATVQWAGRYGDELFGSAVMIAVVALAVWANRRASNRAKRNRVHHCPGCPHH